MRGIWVTLLLALPSAAIAVPSGGWWIPEETQYTAGMPVWTDAGDADNDGDADWAVAQLPAPETHYGNRGLFGDNLDMPPPASPETVYGCGLFPTVSGSLDSAAPAAPGNCRQVEIVDADGDHANEVLLASDTTLAAVRWSGTQFQTLAATDLSPSQFPGPIFRTGDLDNDGQLEIVTSALGTWTGGMGAALRATRFNGVAFDCWVPLPTGLDPDETPIEFVIADADSDGDNDLVLTYSDFEGLSQGVGILPWNGGGFGALIRFRMPGLNPRAVAVADIDADGANEILAGSMAPPLLLPQGLITVFERSGSEVVSARGILVTGEPSAFVVDDVDLDGDQDLLFGAFEGDSSLVNICGLLGGVDLDGPLNPFVMVPQFGLVSLSLATGELSGDGMRDIAAVGGAARMAEVLAWHPAESEEVAEGLVELPSYNPSYDTNADGLLDAADIVTAVNRGLLRQAALAHQP